MDASCWFPWQNEHPAVAHAEKVKTSKNDFKPLGSFFGMPILEQLNAGYCQTTGRPAGDAVTSVRRASPTRGCKQGPEFADIE